MVAMRVVRLDRTALRYARIVGCLIVGVSIGCSDHTEKPVDPPQNLILISIDTLRPDMLGAYGYPRPTSPVLDELADDGTLFLNAFSTSPWTIPAHGSLLTGLYPNRHGAKSELLALSPDVSTLSEILAAHGLRTAAFVNSLFLSKRYGFNKGFDEYEYVEEDVRLESSGMAKRVIQWFATEKPERFFLFLHDYQTHSDYSAQPKYQEGLIRPYEGKVTGATSELMVFRNDHSPLGPRDIEHLVDLYVGGIRQMDAELGRLFRHLQQAGYWENTLIIVTSDHGEEFLEHGGVLHGRTQYDEVLRIPLIMRGPGVPAATRISDSVSIIDVLPTALSLMQIPVGSAPDGTALDGIDVMAAGEDGSRSRQPDRILFAEADHGNAQLDILRSVRMRGFKLIHNRLTGVSEFYATRSDPSEQREISGRHPEMQRMLMEEVEDFDAARIEGRTLPAMDPEIGRKLKALGYLR